MRTNPHVSNSTQPGTPKKGVSGPSVNLPTNNHGTFPVSLGTTHKSKFGASTGPSTAQGGTNQSGGSKANIPVGNTTDKSVKLGHTKHGVGEVPGYLKSY